MNSIKKGKAWFLVFAAFSLFSVSALSSCNGSAKAVDPAMIRKKNVANISATYAAQPRLANGRVDNELLLSQLKDLNVNTYVWLIWRGEKDWDDLQLFLPMAKKNKINVWAYLVPFSESKPRHRWSSEPYGTDYFKWAEEIGKLSLKHSNLTALSIDDFVAWNLQFYTPEYTAKMINILRDINPRVAFVPCIYYRSTKITDYAAQGYLPYFDAILFPYKGEATGKETLKTTSTFKQELDSIRKAFQHKLPVIVDIYSTAHSKAGASTPQYVEDMIKLSKQHADGVVIYMHPDPVKEPEKYKIVKTAFQK